MRGKNWFARHLNWTTVLVAVSWYAFASIEGSGMGWVVGLILSMLICAWILGQKKRDVLWIFILFIPFGWIVFLSLENRSSGLPEIKG